MENLPKYSNTEVLKRRQWYSNKEGFIDITTVSNEHVLNIVAFWKTSRPNMMKKIKRTAFAISKMPKDCADLPISTEKNNRRIEVVKFFDQLIGNEIIKRKLK